MKACPVGSRLLHGCALLLTMTAWGVSGDAGAYRVQRVCEELMTKQGKAEKCRTVLVKEGDSAAGPSGGGTKDGTGKKADVPHGKDNAGKH